MASSTVVSNQSIIARLFGRLARIRYLPTSLSVGAIILAVYFLTALTSSFWVPYEYSQVGIGPPFSQPSLEHLFGTDQLGRDVFSRVVNGTDKELFLALTSTLIALTGGGLLGLLSGLVWGWFDEILMRMFDALISIPLLIFALLVMAAAGPDLSGNLVLLMAVVAIVYMPRIARMARATALDLLTRDFVTVARTRGESIWSIVWRELAPNASGVLLVEFGVRAGYAPILIGSLGFLGFGARPPIPEWGLMVSENRAAIVSAPAAVLAPALALAGLVIGLNLFTDGLARVLGRQVQHGGI